MILYSRSPPTHAQKRLAVKFGKFQISLSNYTIDSVEPSNLTNVYIAKQLYYSSREQGSFC